MFLGSDAHCGAAAASPEPAQRVLAPYASCSGFAVGRAFASVTAAFRRSPANFARFTGDFRNAALNAS